MPEEAPGEDSPLSHLFERAPPRPHSLPCVRISQERSSTQAPCMKEGEYRSTLTRWEPGQDLDTPGLQVVELLCKIHYLEDALGIYTFRCTEECEMAARKRAVWHLDEEDLWTYVPLTMITNEHEVKKVDDEHSIVEAAFVVKCAYCGRVLEAEVHGLRALTF